MQQSFGERAFAVLVVTLLSGFWGNAIAQRSTLLAVELRVSADEVTRSGLVSLQAGLRNTDATRTVVLRGDPGFGPAGGMELHVTDPDGQTRKISAENSYVSVDQARDGVRRTLLRPGEALWVNRRLRVQDFFNTRGTYRLEVRYASELPSPRAPAIAGPIVEGAVAQSNTVELRVID